jgi:ribosomal protein L35
MGKGPKSHASSKKRFKVTGSGRLVRPGAGKKHNTGKHSRRIIRDRGDTRGFGCRQVEKNIRKIMFLPTRF